MISRHRWISLIMVLLLLGLLSGSILMVANSHGFSLESYIAPSMTYGVNVDMSALVPGTPYTIKTAHGGNFFALAGQLGINTIRITDVQWEMNSQEYSEANWQSVFDQAALYHIRVILLFQYGSSGNGPTSLQQARTLLGQYGLAKKSALWIVDLNNEPDVSNSQVMSVLRQEAAYVRQVAPGVLITIGGWKNDAGHPGVYNWQNAADIPAFINLVDVISPHLYQFSDGANEGYTPQQWTEKFLSQVRSQARGKPILLEEFGASNGLETTTSSTITGSQQWQAEVYRGVLEEVTAEKSQGVLGAVAWLMAPRPAFSGDIQKDMTGWSIVLDHGQRILPAAYTFANIEAGT